MSYQMNLRQIRNAILESLYIGVLESLLRCKTNLQVFQQCYGRALTRASARKALDMEVEAWAEIQKSDYGWDMLNTRAHKTLKINGVTPDCWVVNEGVKSYIAGLRRENWAYFLKGPEGPAMYKEQLANGNPKTLDAISNALIFEAKSFNLPSADDPVNVLSRRRTIGEYAVSFPHVDLNSCKSYSSAFRDILVYDENRDGFKKLTLADGIENCCRFDSEGNLYAPSDDMDGDMFFKGGAPLDYLGQMEGDHLPMAAIRDFTRSVCMGLEDEGQTARDIAALKKLVAKLEAKPSGSGSDQKYFKFIKAAYSQTDQGQFDENGLVRLPTNQEDSTYVNLDVGGVAGGQSTLLPFDDGGRALYVPYGFGSAAGIAALAEPRLKTAFPTLHEEAVAAKRGLDAIVTRLEAVMHDNLFMRESSAPPYVANGFTHAAVFANLVHEPRPNVIVLKGATMPVFTDLQKYEMGSFNDEDVINHLLDPSMKGSVRESRAAIKNNNHEAVVNPSKNVLLQKIKLMNSDDGGNEITHLYEIMRQMTRTGMEADKKANLKTIYKVIANKIAHMDAYQVRWFVRKLTDVNFEAIANAAVNQRQMGSPTGATTGGNASQTQLTASRQLKEYLDSIPSTADYSGLSVAGYSVPGVIDTSGVITRPYSDARTEYNKVAAMAGEGEYPDFDDQGRFSGLLKRPRDAEEPNDGIGGAARSFVFRGPEDVEKRAGDVTLSFSTALDKAVAKALLGAPITKAALTQFVAANAVFPFNVIYARPNMTYDMSSGIAMKGGSETGETLVGHADFQLGDNIVQKIHYGNFTFHSKSVVYRQQNVFIAEDMYSTGYVGGNDTSFYRTADDYKKYLDGHESFASIFALLAPYTSQEYPNPMDVTGKFARERKPLNECDDEGNCALHYPTAGFYDKYWGFQSDEYSTDDDSRFVCGSGAMNTMVFQGHQSLYNPSSGLFDLVIKNTVRAEQMSPLFVCSTLNPAEVNFIIVNVNVDDVVSLRDFRPYPTGHWGDRVYPGCGKTRAGHQKLLEPVYYNNIYGGGGNLQGLTK